MTKPKGKGTGKAVAVKLEPVASVVAARKAARQRVEAMPERASPEISTGDGKLVIQSPDSDESGLIWHAMDTLASTSNPFIAVHLKALVNATGRHGAVGTTEDLGSALAFVAAVEPKNEMEAALAVQMYAAHSLALDMITRAKNATFVPQLETYGNLATKAQRTLTAQIEALTKLRTGGKQIVEHRHIYIDNRGGQTVVAENMTSGGTGNGRDSASQSHALSSALLGADPTGHGMPGAPHQGPEAVPNARRSSRRAQG